MEEISVSIPEDAYRAFEFNQEELVGIAIINEALAEFPGKAVFAWHLSIIIHFDSIVENNLPDEAERTQAEQFEDRLLSLLNPDQAKPNALHLGNVTWNKTREIIYRVYDAERANAVIQKIIESEDHPLPFEYQMEPDPDWNLCTWHFQAVGKPDQPDAPAGN